MCPSQCHVVVSLLLFHVSYCQRRIVNGKPPGLNQNFMAYLAKAAKSPQHYDEWICGGALISLDLIVTSAACVEDVTFMYAIAGYRRYVRDDKIETDPCISKIKKKVVMTCVPRRYELDYDQLGKWSFIDIAVVKVDSPYTDQDFNNFCFYNYYIPKPIQVNFEEKYQADGTDAVVLGWGHTEFWRQETDVQNYNSDVLLAASVLLAEKSACMEGYQDFQELKKTIENYMICSIKAGNIDSNGTILSTPEPTLDGCALDATSRRRSKACDDTSDDFVLVESIRRKGSDNVTAAGNTEKPNSTKTDSKNNGTVASNTFKNDTTPFRFMNTRRNGFCQNDHGGPIVTWAGGHQILIGVASVFKVAKNYQCEGPYLYTSTACNSAFLNCIMLNANTLDDAQTQSTQSDRRKFCESPPEVKGFTMDKKYISWTDHPDGPAENEKLAMTVRANATATAANTKAGTTSATSTPKVTADTNVTAAINVTAANHITAASNSTAAINVSAITNVTASSNVTAATNVAAATNVTAANNDTAATNATAATDATVAMHSLK